MEQQTSDMEQQTADIEALKRGEIPSHMTREEAGSLLTRWLFNSKCATAHSQPIHPVRLKELAKYPSLREQDDTKHLSECQTCRARLAEHRLKDAPPVALRLLAQAYPMYQEFLDLSAQTVNIDDVADVYRHALVLCLKSFSRWTGLTQRFRESHQDSRRELCMRIREKLLIADVSSLVVLPGSNKTVTLQFGDINNYLDAEGGVSDNIGLGVTGQIQCNAAGKYTFNLRTNNPFYEGRILRVTGFSEAGETLLTTFIPIHLGEGKMCFKGKAYFAQRKMQDITRSQQPERSTDGFYLVITGEHVQDLLPGDMKEAIHAYHWTQGNNETATECWNAWQETLLSPKPDDTDPGDTGSGDNGGGHIQEEDSLPNTLRNFGEVVSSNPNSLRESNVLRSKVVDDVLSYHSSGWAAAWNDPMALISQHKHRDTSTYPRVLIAVLLAITGFCWWRTNSHQEANHQTAGADSYYQARLRRSEQIPPSVIARDASQGQRRTKAPTHGTSAKKKERYARKEDRKKRDGQAPTRVQATQLATARSNATNLRPSAKRRSRFALIHVPASHAVAKSPTGMLSPPLSAKSKMLLATAQPTSADVKSELMTALSAEYRNIMRGGKQRNAFVLMVASHGVMRRPEVAFTPQPDATHYEIIVWSDSNPVDERYSSGVFTSALLKTVLRRRPYQPEAPPVKTLVWTPPREDAETFIRFRNLADNLLHAKVKAFACKDTPCEEMGEAENPDGGNSVAFRLLKQADGTKITQREKTIHKDLDRVKLLYSHGLLDEALERAQDIKLFEQMGKEANDGEKKL